MNLVGNVTLCLYVRAYWRRLSFSLSSLVQGDFRGRVRITFLRDDPYLSESEEVKRLFGGLLDLDWTDLPGWEKGVTTRKWTRTKSLARTNDIGCCPGWILWSRPDMVYHPTFFSELEAEVQGIAESCVVSWPRYTMSQESGDRLLLPGASFYECAYDSAVPHVTGFSGGRFRRICGAGYAQLVQRSWLNDLGIQEYSRQRGSIGDRAFRGKVGRLHRFLPTNPPIHLQHDRIDANPK